MKELYVVYFESANYAGCGEWVLVWAESEDEARDNPDMLEFAENFYREQDEYQYREENNIDEDEDIYEMWANVQSAEVLKGSSHEEIYLNPKPGCSTYEVFGSPE